MKLALVPLAAALVLAGCSENAAPAAAEAPGAAKQAVAKDAVARPGPDGKVAIEATRDGFHPTRIEGKAGEPLTLVFTRTADKTCMHTVVFPDLKIEKELPMNQPVEVTITPEAGKEIVYHCPMGMGRSTVVAAE